MFVVMHSSLIGLSVVSESVTAFTKNGVSTAYRLAVSYPSQH
jgi:hypothetical protein